VPAEQRLNVHLKTTTLQISVSGKVTAGLFKGMRLSAEAEFRIPARGCTADLSTLTYTQPTAFAIS
jgi:hypothetical protein